MISNLNQMSLELLSQEMLETRWQAFPQSRVHSLQEQNKIITIFVKNGLFKLFYNCSQDLEIQLKCQTGFLTCNHMQSPHITVLNFVIIILYP